MALEAEVQIDDTLVAVVVHHEADRRHLVEKRTAAAHAMSVKSTCPGLPVGTQG